MVDYTGDFTFGGVSRVLATGGSSTPDPDGTFIEIHVDRVGDTALDPASLANADIALSGDGVTDAAGARTVVADPTRGPELLADGETVRYYLTGAFEKGRVQVDWADGAWRDTAGDASVAGSGSFHLIEALEASDAPVPEKIFFIDISGGLELRLADVFDENILEIRGKVSLEIGNVTIDGRKVFRFKLDASGTIKVIKLGNIASGAATFVLQSSGGLADLEFWGVATFATNLSFLEQYGIFLQGSVLLQVNTTGTTKTETLSLEGIPGGTAFLLPVAGAPPLPSGTFSPAPLDAAWIAKLKTPGTNRDLDANDATSAYTLNTGQTHQLQPGFTRRRPDRQEPHGRGPRGGQEVAHQDERRPLLLHRARDAAQRHRRLRRAHRGARVRPRPALGRLRDRRRRADRRSRARSTGPRPTRPSGSSSTAASGSS